MVQLAVADEGKLRSDIRIKKSAIDTGSAPKDRPCPKLNYLSFLAQIISRPYGDTTHN